MPGVFMSKRARAAWLAVIAPLAVLTWIARATASGFPDRSGWVALAMYAAATAGLVMITPRNVQRHGE